MDNQLTVGGIIQNGLLTGVKNAASLLGAVALWLLTLWIPYLNVGTTIGLLGLVAAMSKGEVIKPTEIFDPRYRERMGEFFLVTAFMTVGVVVGLAFVGIPGVVIALTWCLAPLLVVDQAYNPAEALSKSNELTKGKKVTLFFGVLLTNLSATAAVMLITQLGGLVHGFFGLLFGLAGYVLTIAVGMGAQAYVYGTLTGTWQAKHKVPLKDEVALGAAIGAVVVCFGLTLGIGAIHESYQRKKWEAEYAAERARYNEPPTHAAQVAPSLRDEPEQPPAKNVAAAKAAMRRRGK